MTEPRVAIDIVANDRTARGAQSAEKRIGRIPKHMSAVNRQTLATDERRIGRSSRSMLRTFGEVERAGARLFGGRSITAGAAERLGALRAAGAAAGSGLAEASVASSGLGAAVGVAGVAVGATVGILVAAGYAAIKFANGWAEGAASIGRTASLIGVGSKALQEFEAAAQRAGMAKGAGTGALGSLSQSLNDARYGRNMGAVATLGRLGVAMKLKDDGTVDVEAMLPALADAMARQNSSGRRTVASNLGISPDAISVFAQGGKALTADMKDADTHAAVLDDKQIDTGQRIARKGVMVGQLVDKGMSEAGAATAGTLEGGYDVTLSGGRAIADGSRSFMNTVRDSFKPASEKMDRAAGRMERAADRMGSAIGGGVSRLQGGVLNLTGKSVLDLKKGVATEWAPGAGEAQGRGIADTILNRLASGHWGTSVASVLNARKQFSDINGPIAWRQGRHSVDDLPTSRISRRVSDLVDRYLADRARGASSSVGDNLNYANPNYSDRRNLRWIGALDGPALGSGKAVHRHGTTPDLQRYRPGEFRVSSPGNPTPIQRPLDGPTLGPGKAVHRYETTPDLQRNRPGKLGVSSPGNPSPVHVTVELKNAPPGTRATVRSGGAISHAVH